MKPLTVVQIFVVTSLLTQTMLFALAQNPNGCDAPDQFDFEQRLSRLESVLTSEGCVDSGTYRSECVQEPSLYTGYKFLFIKPQMKESFEATVTNVGTGELTLVPLDYNFNATPNIWIGYRASQQLGVRVNYWGYDHSGNGQTLVSDGLNLPGATATTVIYPAAIIAPAPGDVLQTSNSLNVQTFDAEGTYDLHLQRTALTVGGGIRFATTDQQMHAAASRGVVPIGVLDWRRKFSGLGPTVSAAVDQPLVGGFSAVGNFRGSLLYGQKDLNRTVVGDITPAVVAGSPVVNLNNADEVVAAMDLGIGLRYSIPVKQRAELFVQGTFEGQLWTEAGAPTLTFLGFQGFGLATGFTY